MEAKLIVEAMVEAVEPAQYIIVMVVLAEMGISLEEELPAGDTQEALEVNGEAAEVAVVEVMEDIMAVAAERLAMMDLAIHAEVMEDIMVVAVEQGLDGIIDMSIEEV